MTRLPLLTVTSSKQWEAVVSPIRLELWEFLRSNGPCSVRELAGQMERPADGLYHHLRKLITAGLIRETDRRPAGTQIESIYDVVAEDLHFPLHLEQSRNRRWISKLFQAVIRCAGRTVQAALDLGTEADLKSSHRPFSVRWDVGWLSDADLQQVRQHQEAIHHILQRGRTSRKGRLFAVMTYRVPLFRGRDTENETE